MTEIINDLSSGESCDFKMMFVKLKALLLTKLLKTNEVPQIKF